MKGGAIQAAHFETNMAGRFQLDLIGRIGVVENLSQDLVLRRMVEMLEY